MCFDNEFIYIDFNFFFLVLASLFGITEDSAMLHCSTVRQKQTVFGVLPNGTKSSNPLREKLQRNVES